ncbi:unnamed protein product [Mytilus edulis]|uniref:Uncharacterized protein n=1 Tax=Mytilus edulis TaxID=6550 RepID=A0A8S3QH97_MYTED|nr:unnamed protein product [Mytilus edulis]
MHVHFEQNNTTRSECTIHSLSWMGKVPDTLPEDEGGWKLNRNQYYMEGWLAGGNGKGVVGVTFTTSHCRKYDPPQRSNFNLRGHRSEKIPSRYVDHQTMATLSEQLSFICSRIDENSITGKSLLEYIFVLLSFILNKAATRNKYVLIQFTRMMYCHLLCHLSDKA